MSSDFDINLAMTPPYFRIVLTELARSLRWRKLGGSLRATNLGENKVVVANGLDQSKNGSFGTSAAFNEAVFEVAPVLPPTKFAQPASSKPPRRMASPIPPSLLATVDEVIE